MPQDEEQVEQAPADVTPESSPATDVPAPSAETVESQQPESSPSAEAPQEQRVPLDRFQSVIREKEALREQNQQLLALLQRPVQVAPPTPPASDPWDGLVNHTDPGTAQFYQRMQAVVRAERQAAKQEAIQELTPVIQAGMERLAQIDIREFRRDNPDIKPNSEQEKTIVAYMNGQVDGVKHTLESAKRNALFDQLAAENKALKTKQQAVPRKAAANTEASAGIPQVSGMPRRQGSWADRASDVIDKGGSFKEAANAIFG